MTITLAALPKDMNIWMVGSALAVAGIIITVVVYGAVALIVKADDVGLHMAAEDNSAVTRRIGELIVRGMPHFLTLLVIVGTAAMVWVGGSIIVHALSEMGWKMPYTEIKAIAEGIAATMPTDLKGFVKWFVTAFIDGVLGLILGFILIPIVTYVLAPVAGLFSKGEKAAAEGH